MYKIRIINTIKDFFYNSHLDSLNIKDIILAKRYSTEEDKEKIEEGHQVGPYIVIYKKRKKVYGLECTSSDATSPPLLILKYKRKNDYSLDKDGYILMNKIVLLNNSRYINKIGSIDDDDLERIYKYIYLIKKRYELYKGLSKRKLQFSFNVGDIILYKKKEYYINKIDNDYYYTYPVHISKKGNIVLRINNISYFFNFIKEIKIKKKNRIKLLNIANEDMINNINQYINSERNININKPCRGYLINYNNHYYYIYGEYQDYHLVYRIYLDSERTKGMHRIIINKGIYYTLFEESKIKKTDNLTIYRKAKELEMIQIKKIRKSHKNGK